MEAAVKACNSIQNALVLISGALFAFALSADDAVLYEYALDEVIALGQAEELSEFITTKWIVERRSDYDILPIYQESNRTLRDFATALEGSMRELDANIDDERVFQNTIFTNERQAQLGGWERPDLFLSLPSAGATTWGLLTYLEREHLEGTMLVLPSYDFWLYPHIAREARQREVTLGGMRLVDVRLASEQLGKGRIDRFELQPGIETTFGRFRFSFDSEPGVPLVELDVDVPMNRKRFYVPQDEWAELQRSWYASRNIEADMYVPATSKYKNLRMLFSEVGHMPPRQAENWLRDKLADGESTIRFFGATVEQNLVAMAGPMMLSVLMVGLISAMRHIAVLADDVIRINHHDVYWGIISPSRTARIISLVSVSLIPGTTCAVLPFYLGGGFAAWSCSGLGVLIAFAVFLNVVNLPLTWTMHDGATQNGDTKSSA